MLFQRETTIFIRLMTENDKKDFERLNRKYEKEISNYCQEGASIWEWEDFVHDPFRAGYMICLKNPDVKEHIPPLDDYDIGEPYETPGYKEEINVGFILCDYDNYTWNGSCYIQQFFVDETFRRKGVGMLAVNELLKKEWKLTLHVMKNNEPAQRFWREVKQELDLEDWCEENFLKMETTDEFCDFFGWKSRKMQRLLDRAYTYKADVPVPVGEKIYERLKDISVRKHEDFNAWYDIFGRLVIIDDDKITDRLYYMVLDGEDSFIVFHDRTQVYVFTDSDVRDEELFKLLVTKADRIKEYLTVFEQWQRIKQFFTRREPSLGNGGLGHLAKWLGNITLGKEEYVEEV